jgi:hypothetical protein
MEPSPLLNKVKAFLKQVEEDDPAPVPLEENPEGLNVEMTLGLGVYSVQPTDSLKYDSVGVIIPELLDKEEEDDCPAPFIEEIPK